MQYIIASHYEDGPSLWIRSNYDKAIDLAITLMEQELDESIAGSFGWTEDNEDYIKLKNLLFVRDFFAAHEFWLETQKYYEVDFVEAIIITACTVDGEQGFDLSCPSPDFSHST